MKRQRTGFSQSVYQTLRWAYGPFWGRMLVLLILGLIGRLFLLANANLVGKWLDLGAPKPVQFLLLLAGLICLGFFLTWVFRVGFSRFSAHAVSLFYDEVTLRTSRYPMDFFRSNPSGRIVTRFSSDYGNVFRLFGGPLAEFVSIVYDLLLISSLMLAASWYFAPVLLLMVVCYWSVFKGNRSRLLQNRRLLSSRRSPSIAHFAESLLGAGAIRSFQRERHFLKKFSELDSLFLEQRKTTVRLNLWFSLQMNALTALTFVFSALGCWWLHDRGLVSSGQIGVLFGFVVFSGNTVQMFFDWLSQFEDALVGVERLDEYLRLPLETGAWLPEKAQFPTKHARAESLVPAQPRTSLIPEIRFQDVWFRYHEGSPWILKELSVAFQPGEKIGIIGRTGSGKSTLIQLLFHLDRTTRGQILIDGQVVKSLPSEAGWDLRDFRNLVSYVPQEPSLFQGTLKKNLDLRGQAPEDLCLDVLRRVGLERFATSAGLQMNLEEYGKSLSLGERQLICLARALLQRTPVLVMDEATSSVDPQSEELMTQAAQDLFADRTQLIVAHRLSTLRYCQKVLWMDQGMVRMFGPREEVLAEFQNFMVVQEHGLREQGPHKSNQ